MTASPPYKAWPFIEAQRIIERCGGKLPDKGYILFSTGYGPSGLPHIGTFGEVLRTTMVRKALEMLTGWPTRLIAFSDDMDGLRKVPTNVPNQDLLKQHLHQPLTVVPDPFGKYPSFGEHNNAMLCAFLDRFGFEYEFTSATHCYQSGLFDNSLRLVLKHYDAIMAIMLPSLGEERQGTYSPFLPICPRTGQVLQVPILARDETAGAITYQDPTTHEKMTVPITGGHCKLQWKVDWAMRWQALAVDYEMSGKDLIDSVTLSSKICRVLGKEPPLNLTYELFLDEKGQKISKSKGNGLSLEQWLSYAPEESLAYYMFLTPTRAKRLYFDVIPKAADEYLTFLQKFPAQTADEQRENPVWHIHNGKPPALQTPLSFSLLLNLATACNAEEKSVLWGFISRYAPGVTAETAPLLDTLAGYAVRYYQDFVKPHKQYRVPTAPEKAAMAQLKSVLQALPTGSDAEAIQTSVYAVGGEHGFTNLRDWFQALYEVLLGQSQGPRFGSFIALFGLTETITLLEEKAGV
jgi:lysyl-tRNA synthetase, class I